METDRCRPGTPHSSCICDDVMVNVVFCVPFILLIICEGKMVKQLALSVSGQKSLTKRVLKLGYTVQVALQFSLILRRLCQLCFGNALKLGVFLL